MAKIVRKNQHGFKNDALFMCDDNENRFIVLHKDLIYLEDIVVPTIINIYNDLDNDVNISDIEIPDTLINLKLPVYPIVDVNSDDHTEHEMHCSHGKFSIIFDLEKWKEIWCNKDYSFKERKELSESIVPETEYQYKFQSQFMEYGFENIDFAMGKSPSFANIYIEESNEEFYLVIKYFGPRMCRQLDSNNKCTIELTTFLNLAHYAKRHPDTSNFFE